VKRSYEAAVQVAVLVCLATPAAAHVPQLRGRLIDLATQSDVIVFATVEQSSRTREGNATTIRVDRWLAGAASDQTVVFIGGPRVAPGERYVFFLRREPGRLTCLQPTGTVFASRPQDDRAYTDAIAAIRAAVASSEDVRAVALRTAMIGALTAPAPVLRFHAVLELAALAHDGFPERERRALERIAADPSTDPAIRPALTSLLATAETPLERRASARP